MILSFPVCAHIQAFLSSFIYVDIFILTISFHPWGLRFPITAWKTNPCGGVSQSKPLAHIRTHSPRCPVLLYSICGEQLHCTSAVQPSNTASYNIGLFTALSLLGSVCLSIMQFPVSFTDSFHSRKTVEDVLPLIHSVRNIGIISVVTEGWLKTDSTTDLMFTEDPLLCVCVCVQLKWCNQSC